MDLSWTAYNPKVVDRIFIPFFHPVAGLVRFRRQSASYPPTFQNAPFLLSLRLGTARGFALRFSTFSLVAAQPPPLCSYDSTY